MSNMSILTHKVMLEFLKDFDSLMATRGRKVLLLIDNFSAHELAIEIMEEARALRFTKVIWLPANSTSLYQPLDQGIIQCWKTHTRAQFVTFMVKNFDDGKDFRARMNVLRAIRWGISCWENDVSKATIQNCWGRSQYIDWGHQPSTSTIIVEGTPWDKLDSQLSGIRTQLQDLRDKGAINEVPNIKDFVDGLDKVVADKPEDLVNQIVQQYQPEELEEDSDSELLLPKVTNTEALYYLHQLRRYEEQQDYYFAMTDLLQILRRYERELARRHDNENKKQVDIRHWINGHVDKDN